MSLRIVGAGAVGLALAARLARAGQSVQLTTDRPEIARALREKGLTAEHPASGETFRVAVDARAWEEPAGPPGEDPVLICTRSDAVEDVCRSLVPEKGAGVVTFQNDVVSEEAASAVIAPVFGGVWRETCTRVDENRVRFLFDRPGRAILGLHPKGKSPAATRLAAVFETAGIRTGVSDEIGRDKWLKLCVNLMSAPNALIRRADHTSRSFAEVKIRLLEEARAVLAAAGIETGSCDGRDRSLDEEIEFQRRARAEGSGARAIPLYNQVWAALRHGGHLEADGYHQRIIDLGREYDVAVPVNQRVLEALRAADRAGTGPESLAADALLA